MAKRDNVYNGRTWYYTTVWPPKVFSYVLQKLDGFSTWYNTMSPRLHVVYFYIVKINMWGSKFETIANIKITKDELIDSFVFEFFFMFEKIFKRSRYSIIFQIL